jgi:hypothetical protein
MKQSGLGASPGLNNPGQSFGRDDMRRGIMAWLLGLLAATPMSAQAPAFMGAGPTDSPAGQLDPVPQFLASPTRVSTSDELGQAEAMPWQTIWGLIGLRVIPAGPKTAPNGEEYHPNFSIDLNANLWVWRSQGLYLFGDMRLWGETGEYGVTNSRDGWLGTSKRQFDFSGGAAWNYEGPWEARAFGYTQNNLNRGVSPLLPSGFTDGFGMENRYYLSPEYAKLGQTGFDVAKATFVSIGYYPSKDMEGNDGKAFTPGLLLRAYLTYNLWDSPCYLFGDISSISESSGRAKLLLFDVGIAARPLHSCQQWEFRLGVENTADLQVRDVQNLWYASFRYIF